MKTIKVTACISVFVITVLILFSCSKHDRSGVVKESITIIDDWNRSVTVPKEPEHVICSGPGCLRYLSYLQSQDKIVAVDDMEKRRSRFDARPYALANPEFKNKPLFGEFRGHDNPELIVGLKPLPEVIFKTFGDMGHDPVELQKKTGIPVVVLNYGDMLHRKKEMFQSLRLMGKVMGKEERAEEVISFFEESIADLNERAASIKDEDKKSCYIGGIAFRGPHGFQSTEPNYPPFAFVNARNSVIDASMKGTKQNHADISKEQIIHGNPDIIFVDLSTLQMSSKSNALKELKNDPVYQGLSARNRGEIYGVLPYNWYSKNYGSILADAYFIGKVLYPEGFRDIDIVQKADKIYHFLVGKRVYSEMNGHFRNMLFTRIHL